MRATEVVIVLFVFLQRGSSMDDADKQPTAEANLISAQVVLKSASGKRITPDVVVTSETVADYLPSAEAIADATKAYKEAGFQVGTLVGNNFAVTAPIEMFEKLFKAQLKLKPDGSVEVASTNKPGDQEKQQPNKKRLPLQKVPPSLRAHVEEVLFTSPPDFGG